MLSESGVLCDNGLAWYACAGAEACQSLSKLNIVATDNAMLVNHIDHLFWITYDSA